MTGEILEYLIYGGDATLAVHAKAVLLPKWTFSVQVDLLMIELIRVELE